MLPAMEATTPGLNLDAPVTWPTLNGVFNTIDTDTDFNYWSLGDFNNSNLSGAGVYGDETQGERVWDDLWRGIPLGIVLAFLCLLTTVGNIMVLHAVRTEKRLQTLIITNCRLSQDTTDSNTAMGEQPISVAVNLIVSLNHWSANLKWGKNGNLGIMERRQCIRQQQQTTSTSIGKTSLSIRNKKYEKLFKMRSESSSESSTDSSDSQESITSKQSDSSLVSMSSSSDSSFSSTPQSTTLKARSVLMPDNAMEMIVQRLMSLKVPNLSGGLKSSPGDKRNSSRPAENGSDSMEGLKPSTRATPKSASHVSHSVNNSGSLVSEADSIELSSLRSRASTADFRDPARSKQQAKPCVTSHARQTHKPRKSSPTSHNTHRALRAISGTNRNLIVKRKRHAKKSDELLSPFKMYTITDDYPLTNNLALHPVQSESSHEPTTKNTPTRGGKVSPRNHGRTLHLDEPYQEEIEEVISLSTDDEIVQFSNKWEHINEDDTSRKVNKRYVFTKVI